jgi:hypothetical protein
MLERIAEALEIDTLELFSVRPYPAESLKQLHEGIILDFQRILNGKLQNLDDTK